MSKKFPMEIFIDIFFLSPTILISHPNQNHSPVQQYHTKQSFKFLDHLDSIMAQNSLRRSPRNRDRKIGYSWSGLCEEEANHNALTLEQQWKRAKCSTPRVHDWTITRTPLKQRRGSTQTKKNAKDDKRSETEKYLGQQDGRVRPTLDVCVIASD